MYRAMKAQPNQPGDEQLLRIGAVIQKTGMARSTIYKKIRSEEFPRPLVIAKRLVAWRQSEINSWIKSLKNL